MNKLIFLERCVCVCVCVWSGAGGGGGGVGGELEFNSPVNIIKVMSHR